MNNKSVDKEIKLLKHLNEMKDKYESNVKECNKMLEEIDLDQYIDDERERIRMKGITTVKRRKNEGALLAINEIIGYVESELDVL